MQELQLADYYKLIDLYLGNTLSERRLLYFLLREIKQQVIIDKVKLNGKQQTICSNLESFLLWVDLNFSEMTQYLKEENVPPVFAENEFPKFQKKQIQPQETVNSGLQIIKKIEIWGIQQKIQQNYRKIEEIDFDGQILTFYLSNNSFLRIWNPQYLLDSDYSLQIKYSTKIALAMNGKEVIKYILKNNYDLEVWSNKEVKTVINCSSVFVKAIEVIK